jgi:hypothetical protein
MKALTAVRTAGTKDGVMELELSKMSTVLSWQALEKHGFEVRAQLSQVEHVEDADTSWL